MANNSFRGQTPTQQKQLNWEKVPESITLELWDLTITATKGVLQARRSCKNLTRKQCAATTYHLLFLSPTVIMQRAAHPPGATGQCPEGSKDPVFQKLEVVHFGWSWWLPEGGAQRLAFISTHSGRFKEVLFFFDPNI